MKLCLMDNDDLKAQVKQKNVKQVFEKELVFYAPFIKLLTILHILQKFDQLV